MSEIVNIEINEQIEIVNIEVQETVEQTIIEISEGKKGDKGEPGTDGDDGIDGDDGLSAYEVWLQEPGNEGMTLDDYFDFLKAQNSLEDARQRGDFMNGPFSMNNNAITGIKPAEEDTQAVPLGQAKALANEAINSANLYTDQMTLEKVRGVDNKLGGDVNAGGNRVTGAGNAQEDQDYVTLLQLQQSQADALAYADSVSLLSVRWAGYWDPSTGLFPNASGIRRGDEYEANSDGVIGTIEIERGDIVRARINTPGQSVGNWSIAQGNTQQATETVRGIAKVADSNTVSNQVTTNNTDFVTSVKLWLSFWPKVLQLAHVWTGMVTFNNIVNLPGVGIAKYLRTDNSSSVYGVTGIPSSDITGTKTSSFISDLASAVLAIPLTGLSVLSGVPITAADNLLLAFGKLQKQLTDQASTVSGHTTSIATNASNISALAISAPAYTDAQISLLKDGVATSGNTLQKLYNLITASINEVSVANIAARNAYNVPSTPFNIFVVDDGDGKWATYKAITTGIGATFVKTSDPDLLNAVMSNSAIKTAYESNADTNAFTNALKTRLDNLTSTSGLSEGTNQYFTQARAIAAILTGIVFTSAAPVTNADSILIAIGKLQAQITANGTTIGLKETASNKDASGGYAGLTLFKLNIKNVLGTFTSYFTNSNTASRTYTLQDRDGTLLDNTDLAYIKSDAHFRADKKIYYSDFVAHYINNIAVLNPPFGGLVFNGGTSQQSTLFNSSFPQMVGVLVINSGTSANGGYAWHTSQGSSSGLQIVTGSVYNAIFALPAAMTDVVLRLGFLQATAVGAVTNGVYLELNNSYVANGITMRTSVSANAATTTTLSATTPYHLRITATSATQFLFEIYSITGTLIWSDTATQGGSSVVMGMGMIAYKTTVSASTTALAYIDYMSFEHPAATRGSIT